jgi:hypothetical protein
MPSYLPPDILNLSKPIMCLLFSMAGRVCPKASNRAAGLASLRYHRDAGTVEARAIL